MSTEFGTGQATGDAGDAVAMDATREAMAAISADEPDFCQVFCSPAYDYEAVLWGARSVIGSEAEIVGCSSSGEFTEAGAGDGTVTVGVVLLNVMLVVGLIQVLNRYVEVPIDLYWTYEVARTILAMMTIIAIPYLFKNDADISFLPVLRRITSGTDRFLLIRNALMAALSVVLAYSAYLAYGTAGDTGLPTVSWFKVGWGYLLFGVAAVVLLVVVIGDTKRRIDEIRGGTDV
mgnify:CR=1 FL=1